MTAKELFIPDLGALIQVAEPWTFPLWCESRNAGLIKGILGRDPRHVHFISQQLVGPDVETLVQKGYRVLLVPDYDQKDVERHEKFFGPHGRKFDYPQRHAIEVTIPEGVVLSIDRLYVRRGSERFNSVTFRVNKKQKEAGVFAGTRFWAKLADVNRLKANVVL